ncbi:hypothetical protein STEG23_014288, partial [Scotinomys teguina]
CFKGLGMYKRKLSNMDKLDYLHSHGLQCFLWCSENAKKALIQRAVEHWISIQ